MFDKDFRDMTMALSQMERLSRERTNFDQIAAREKLRGFIEQDRRFDDYDHDRLAARVLDCRQCGATLDLDSPELLKGGEPRPLSFPR